MRVPLEFEPSGMPRDRAHLNSRLPLCLLSLFTHASSQNHIHKLFRAFPTFYPFITMNTNATYLFNSAVNGTYPALWTAYSEKLNISATRIRQVVSCLTFS